MDVEFLRKGLHDAGQQVMLQTIQNVINSVEKDRYDAILLGYGRCNNGVVGLEAKGVTVVIPRVHDCIGLFFGSNRAYEEYFHAQPGTYYRTTGWMERDSFNEDSIMHQLGLDSTYDEYVAKYGKEKADYIMQSIGAWQERYKVLAYIEMGLPVDDYYRRLAQIEAQERNLEFQSLQGDMSLLRNLINGNWNEEDFLVVKGGEKVASEDHGRIMMAVSSTLK